MESCGCPHLLERAMECLPNKLIISLNTKYRRKYVLKTFLVLSTIFPSTYQISQSSPAIKILSTDRDPWRSSPSFRRWQCCVSMKDQFTFTRTKATASEECTHLCCSITICTLPFFKKSKRHNLCATRVCNIQKYCLPDWASAGEQF